MKTDANIKDVASHAGVSTGTVSRVLRGEQGVRADKAQRVHQAVKQLGYTLRGRRPLGSGRAPGHRKTGNIGFFLPIASAQWANHPLYSVVFRGLDQACSESGFHYLTEYGEMTGNKPRMLTEQKIDGLLVKGASTPWLEQIAGQFPIVGLNLNQPGLLYDQINCDDYHSGYSAAEYLWSRGHRRIAFVSNISHHPMLLMRYQGYERFLRLQRRFNPQLVYLRESQLIEPSAPEQSYPQFDDVLSCWAALPVEQCPTAVLAANDWNAAGCYQTARRLGLNIPEDLSILGFDNTVELCTLLEPHLSSFKVAQEQCAYLAAKRLIQKIDDGPHDDLPLVQSVVGELVSRDSVRSIEVTD